MLCTRLTIMAALASFHCVRVLGLGARKATNCVPWDSIMSVWYDTAQNVFLILLRPSCLNEPDGTITHDLIERGLGLFWSPTVCVALNFSAGL